MEYNEKTSHFTIRKSDKMKEDIYCIVAFDSTHHAIQLEKILKKQGLEIKTIPTPKEISASCGLSIRFNTNLQDKVKEEIKNLNLSIYGMFKIKKMDNKKIVEEIV